jgi:hypothetical protein
MIRLALTLSLLALPVWAGDLPDPVTTPGALNPQVTQANIDSTICVSGWTKTIRPPASYTNALKAKQMKALNLPGPPSAWEEDHVVSLELGGDPRSPLNLWPQHWSEPWGAHRKDAIETKLKHLVCDHTITLNEAQQAISTDWIAAYKKYVSPPP